MKTADTLTVRPSETAAGMRETARKAIEVAIILTWICGIFSIVAAAAIGVAVNPAAGLGVGLATVLFTSVILAALYLMAWKVQESLEGRS